ncbi:hypothetical protein NMY22_g9969 [Coprinellus aureogranulatus]|nr:hypothetical protein NMY22_g9969 [Coprinellus aureogranulatus]
MLPCPESWLLHGRARPAALLDRMMYQHATSVVVELELELELRLYSKFSPTSPLFPCSRSPLLSSTSLCKAALAPSAPPIIRPGPGRQRVSTQMV